MEYKSFMEALKGKQHKIDKNKNGKVDSNDFELLRKEETELEEATVKTQKYSWGTMKTVHHGSDFSIPLHPEHHQEIAKLKDQQEHKFKDETGRHWTAKRSGDDVHFQGANGGNSTKVKHSTMSEEVEQIQEREDDEYHTPSKHHVHVTISKGVDGKKEHRKATVTAKEPSHAVNAALKHYKSQGYTVHDHKYLGEEAEQIDEIARMKTKLNKLDDVSNKSVARQKLSNLMKSGKARGALIANKMRTLNMGDDIDQEDLDALNEVLSKDAKAGDWIHDFVHSDNPKFDGKSKKERIKMALGAYYGKQNEETVEEGYYEKPASAYLRKGDEVRDPTPVAPVPDRKYIKGTPEHKAYKATKKPINGHPTNEEVEQIDEVSDVTKNLANDIAAKHKNMKVSVERGNVMIHHKDDDEKIDRITLSHTGNNKFHLHRTKSSGEDVSHRNLTADEVHAHAAKHIGESVLDERNKQNAMMRKTMDASRGARYKLNNPVPDADPKHKTARDHNVAIGRALRNEDKMTTTKDKSGKLISFKYDSGWKKSDPTKQGSGKAANLAGQAMQKMAKANEEVEVLDELHPLTYMSYHNKATAIGRDGAKAFDKSGKDRSANIAKADKRVIDSVHGKGPLAKLYPTGKKSTLGKKAQAAVRSNAQWNEEVEELEEGDLSIRHLYNKFADAHVGGHDTKPTEKAIRKVHGDEVFKHMKKAATANAKGDMDGEEKHFDNAQTAGRKTDRIGGTVGRGRSEFMRKRREWSEEVKKDEGEYDQEGDMAKTQLRSIKYHADELHEMLDDNDNLPEWVQSKLTLAQDYLQTVCDYMYSKDDVNEEKKSVEVKVNAAGDAPHEEKWEPVKKIKKPVAEQVQKVDIPAYLRKAKGDTPLKMDDLKRKDTLSDAENLKRNRGVKESFDDEGNLIPTKISYKDFITEIKLADLPVRRIQGHSYGANYSDPEGADDYDDKKPMKPAAEKRGRGRPAGAKSGARKITGTSKLMNK